ncbi:MAG TPA: hypothetical protein VLZ05_25390 [Mycobacterium sp.]|nr:hypothetical protein [Mycobacterium sp.]
MDSSIYLVRDGRADALRARRLAATAEGTERVRVSGGWCGYPKSSTERDSGADQHFRDHVMVLPIVVATILRRLI